MSVYMWFVVIFVTFMCLVFGVGWMLEHADRRAEKLTLLAMLDAATANVQLPRPGRLQVYPDEWNEVIRAGRMPFAGAADPSYEIRSPSPIPWDLAGAAYALGQQRADQDQVSREVEAIFAEVEHNPERWQR